MRYHLAIPSHRRAKLFEEQTLAFLDSAGVERKRINVFLSDDEDKDAYARLDVNLIVTGAPNLTDKFNYIHNHWEPGERVFVMEDDIVLLEGGNNRTSQVVDLDRLVQAGFGAVGRGGIFGVAPHSNSFYFSGKITRTLKLVVAHAFGFVSTRDKRLEVTQPSKTDYERTCRYYARYRQTVRLDMYGVKTKSYTMAGGMQADMDREQRLQAERTACDYLVHAFPRLIAHNVKKKSMYPELRFLTQKNLKSRRR